jgi:hypothetical protein
MVKPLSRSSDVRNQKGMETLGLASCYTERWPPIKRPTDTTPAMNWLWRPALQVLPGNIFG